MDVTQYMRNPVVLFGHDYASPPVARTVSLTTSESGITARFIFPERGISARADEIHALWDAQFLSAVSVGFIPLEWAQDATDPTITKSELLEFSIVPVPANQEALRMAIEQAQVSLKEGRVLSSKNYDLIKQCIDSLNALLVASEPENPSGDGEDNEKAVLEALYKVFVKP